MLIFENKEKIVTSKVINVKFKLTTKFKRVKVKQIKILLLLFFLKQINS